MSKTELEELAALVAEKIIEKQEAACHLTPEEQQAVKDLLNTKKNAVRITLGVLGAILLWILKDVYIYLATHLALK